MRNYNTVRYLTKIAGKILFIIGLTLCILMLLYGFWPSLIYILILLAGAGMFSLNKGVDIETTSLRERGEKLKRFLRRFPGFPLPRFSAERLALVTKTVLLSFLGLVLAGSLILWLAQGYIKERDTRNDCREIVSSLTDYFQHKNRYPNDLKTIVNNNPLRQNWYKDHWDNNYSYKTGNNGKTFTLISAGKDGKFDTKDDLIYSNN